ncbi:MAG: hypothetical protein WCC48_05750 [Anaeromyxobacteraceae bacterium]
MNLDSVAWREGLFGAFLLWLGYHYIAYRLTKPKPQATEKPEPEPPVRRPEPAVSADELARAKAEIAEMAAQMAARDPAEADEATQRELAALLERGGADALDLLSSEARMVIDTLALEEDPKGDARARAASCAARETAFQVWLMWFSTESKILADLRTYEFIQSDLSEPERRLYLDAAENERKVVEEAMLSFALRAFPNGPKRARQPKEAASAGAEPAGIDKKARFDALLAGADAPDPLRLRKLLAGDLNLMRRDYMVGGPQADTERIAVLIGLTRDEKLWRRLVRYLTDVDSAHRYNQKYSGVSKEDLGPIPSEARSATWVRSEAKHVALPEVVRRRVDETLKEMEEALR